MNSQRFPLTLVIIGFVVMCISFATKNIYLLGIAELIEFVAIAIAFIHHRKSLKN